MHVKVKVNPDMPMQAQRRGRGIAPPQSQPRH